MTSSYDLGPLTGNTWYQYANSAGPPPQTYLDARIVQIHLSVVERTPESREFLYRGAMNAILRWLFPEQEGFDIVQEEDRDPRPDFVVFKICCRPGGSNYSYDFCVVESKATGRPWGSTEDQCSNQCDEVDNESGKLYAMVHIGMEVAFYQYDNGSFSRMSGRLHLRHDVSQVMEWASHLKNNPLPIVDN